MHLNHTDLVPQVRKTGEKVQNVVDGITSNTASDGQGKNANDLDPGDEMRNPVDEEQMRR